MSEKPTTFAGLSGLIEDAIEKAYWDYDTRKNRPGRPQPERDAFKWAVREMLLRIGQPLP